MEKGFIITLSGISGAGKSYFIKSMTERFESFEKLKAVTTREKRKDEVEGVDKFFLDLNSFEEKNKNGEMTTVNNVFGNMYGYYKRDIDKTNNGTCLITELYYKEVENFKKEHPNTISVYILPNDIAVTLEELKKRNTSYEEYEKRVNDIKKEIAFFKDSSGQTFDIIIINNYDDKSIEEFISLLFKKIEEITNNRNINRVKNVNYNGELTKIADEYSQSKDKKDVIYTSFYGDDMHYLHDICKTEIDRGNIPLNPETSLGYYISTVTLGGKKIEVMKDCLTLETIANKMSVYKKNDRKLSEGILAEMILWYHNKCRGLEMISDVTNLSSYEVENLELDKLLSLIDGIDPIAKYELENNLLKPYLNENHESVYIIANMTNFKHIDWARIYCYKNGLCPISPQNILPLHLYKDNMKDYLLSRLELLSRADRILLFIDKNNFEDELSKLDDYSTSEIYYARNYLKDKNIEIIGWDEALVPKYDPNSKWALTTNEDIEIRKLIK